MDNGALFVMTNLTMSMPLLCAECWDIRLALLMAAQHLVEEAEESGWMMSIAAEMSPVFLIVLQI